MCLCATKITFLLYRAAIALHDNFCFTAIALHNNFVNVHVIFLLFFFFQYARYREQITPEGHRAPLADLLRATRSVNTQTPATDLPSSSYSSGKSCDSVFMTICFQVYTALITSIIFTMMIIANIRKKCVINYLKTG